MKNTGFLQSLSHAAAGFWAAIKRERNLRFHLTVTNLLCVFAYHYGLGRTEWAALVLTITLVIGAELMNTAVEKAVDTATRQRRLDAKHAKDIAAAAVLTTAAGAVVIGLLLFGEPERLIKTLEKIFTTPGILVPVLFLVCLDLCFLFLPAWIKKR